MKRIIKRLIAMIKTPTSEDLEKGRELHDKIKNHPFRLCPQIQHLDEYVKLFDLANNLFGRYVLDYFDHDTLKNVYKYHTVEKEDRYDGDNKYTHYVDIWSNPTIALLDESMHDLRSISMKLKWYWKDDTFRKGYLGSFIETTEIWLQLLHRLIEGVEINEISFPKDKFSYDGKYEYKFYKYVKNPKYNNNWTLEKELPYEKGRLECLHCIHNSNCDELFDHCVANYVLDGDVVHLKAKEDVLYEL